MHVQVSLLQLRFFPTIALPREIKQVQAYGLKTWNLGQRFRCVCVCVVVFFLESVLCQTTFTKQKHDSCLCIVVTSAV